MFQPCVFTASNGLTRVTKGLTRLAPGFSRLM